MTKTLVLHIGTHKTGTTALQGAPSSNPEALSAHGYVYPSVPVKWSNAAQEREQSARKLAKLEAKVERSKLFAPRRLAGKARRALGWVKRLLAGER